MYQQQQYAPRGVSILTVGSNPYVNVRFCTTGPAYPSGPSSAARTAFRSSPPTSSGVKPCNLAQLLPPQHFPSSGRTSAASSTSSADVGSHTTSSIPSQKRRHRRRRSSTTSVVSQPQNNWASRSRTPESQIQPAAPLQLRKVTLVRDEFSVNSNTSAAGPKKTSKRSTTKKQRSRTKDDKIRAMYYKGEKVGKLSPNTWFKAPKTGYQPPAPTAAPQNPQRPAAAKKQRPVRRQAKRQAAQHKPVRASPETLKALKKLRKKVKQCTKIQEKLNQGLKVQDDELAKLKQVNEFRQQIAVLQAKADTEKEMGQKQGFTTQRRR